MRGAAALLSFSLHWLLRLLHVLQFTVLLRPREVQTMQANSGIVHGRRARVQPLHKFKPRVSALTERDIAEQRFLFARLRTPVLRRRFDGRTQLRSRVPRPARIVEQRTRQLVFYRFAGFQNFFSIPPRGYSA